MTDVVPEVGELIGIAGASNSWIFQADPRLYDIRVAISTLKQQTWLVARFKDEINRGDKVYLWESGPHGGIVGVAEVVESPRMGRMPGEELPFAKSPDKFEGEQSRPPVLSRKAKILGRSRLPAEV